MRPLWLLLVPLCVTGCATNANRPPPGEPASAPPALPAHRETKVVETRYDLRGYREATDPSLRHEAHAVFRRTRVPTNCPDSFVGEPRESFAPASVAPLPASTELRAELATQRQLTAEMRAMHAALAAAGEKLTTQYNALVRQSADAVELRRQLQAERSRLPAPAPRATPEADSVAAEPPKPATEVKW